MGMTRRWQCLGVAGLGMALAGVAGCQTHVAGMTLPSSHYLEHRPQYFPPDPDFPLQRELTTQLSQHATTSAVAPGIAGVLPPPLPAGPAAITPTPGSMTPATTPQAAPAGPGAPGR
jgi:hypothetical protein